MADVLGATMSWPNVYGVVSEMRASIDRYLCFYNEKRSRSCPAARTPDQMYFDNLPDTIGSMILAADPVRHGR